MTDVLIVVVAGFAAGFICSMSSGGTGVIHIVALLYVGLPINAALATNILGNVGQQAAIYNFWRSGLFRQRNQLPIIAITLAGALVGAAIIINVDQAWLAKLGGFGLAVILLLSLLSKKAFETQRRPKSVWPLGYFAGRVLAGTGLGLGLLSVLALIHLGGMTGIQAVSSNLLANGVSDVINSVILITVGLTNMRLGLPLLAANLAGSWLGSKTVIKGGNRLIRYVIVGMTAVAIAQLLSA